MKEDIVLPKQAPDLESEKRRDRGATQRHQKWNKPINTSQRGRLPETPAAPRISLVHEIE